MTNPVVLYGTQSNGETLPVQVDATGRLIAEGLQGEKGDKGDQGDQGIQGEPGPPGNFELPPNPEQGQVLGWDNGALAWFTIPGLDPGYRVTIRDEIVNNPGDSGFRDAFGSLTTPADGWDAAARELPNWMSTPSTGDRMGVSTGNGRKSIEVLFDINNALGMILELSFYAWFTKNTVDDTALNVTSKVICTGSNTSIINNEKSVEYKGRNSQNKSYAQGLKAQFLLSRDSYDGLGFRFTMSNDTSIKTDNYMVVSGWQVIDPGLLALQNQVAFAQELERVASDLKEGSTLETLL